MHRKFIALIVSTAIAITAFTSAPARADDTAKVIGGLAALAILGAAIHHRKEKKERERARAEAQQPVIHSVRPLPHNVARYDLPGRCLKPMWGYPSNAPLLGPKCLSHHYRYVGSLPQACRVTFWNGRRTRDAFEPRCLRRKGYRIVG